MLRIQNNEHVNKIEAKCEPRVNIKYIMQSQKVNHLRIINSTMHERIARMHTIKLYLSTCIVP